MASHRIAWHRFYFGIGCTDHITTHHNQQKSYN